MRARRGLAAAALLAACGAAAAALVFGTGGGDEVEAIAVPARPADGVDVAASVSPPRHLFGDTVLARLDVVVDEASVDPERVGVNVRVEPFERRGEAVVRRSSSGGVTLIRYEYTLLCLVAECAPVGGEKQIRLPFATVSYGRQNGPATLERLIEWPELVIGARAGLADAVRPRARADLVGPIATTAGIDPTVLGWLAAALAAAVALVVGGFAAWRLWRRRADDPGPAAPVAADPLDAALARFGTLDDGPPARRAALDGLARVLASTGRVELAGRARRLAWSRDDPSVGDVEALADEIRVGTSVRHEEDA